jgi:hypothetical protein
MNNNENMSKASAAAAVEREELAAAMREGDKLPAADSARIAHLTHERDIARRDCAALQAEVEALRKRVLPEGWQAIGVAWLRAELMTQRDTTETYGYSAETARVAIEGCIETLDEHAAAPQPPAQVEAAQSLPELSELFGEAFARNEPVTVSAAAAGALHYAMTKGMPITAAPASEATANKEGA